jgi:seryl-tRNA synthetase
MIDIKLLENKGDSESPTLVAYKKTLQMRGYPTDGLNEVLALNKKRKEFITAAETAKASQNKASGEIAKLKREGKDASSLLGEMGKLSGQVKELEAKASEVDQEVNKILLTLPNQLNAEVPEGKGAEDNVEIKKIGQPRKFSFKAKEHWDIGEQLGIIDFERAGKVTGTRFAFLKGGAAQLERALIQYFMDLHSQKHGYVEMIPPYMVNTNSYIGTGQFPKFVEDVFHLEKTDYFLASTAEVPVTNYYRDEILEESMLPQKFAAFSPCFRSEAGSHGRDTKGLIRQHQFHKVELMIYSHPSQSYQLHEQLTLHAEKCLEDLELPYKRMLLCSRDIGFGAAKCFDLEVHLPGTDSYREISSCSNFEDFQARRAMIRFRPGGGGKPQFVHTINGSGLAVGRTLIAILENYQKEDGSIEVPKVLRPYMSGKSEIKKS